MRSSTPFTALAAALTLVACGTSSGGGSAGGPAATSAATVPLTTATTTTAPSVPSTTSTVSTATTQQSGSPPCTASDLSLSYLGGRGATGHGELGFALRNASSHACSTIGYPGIQFLDRSGTALPTIPTHTTQDFFGSVPRVALTVGPGATVSFRLGVTHGAASATGCTTAYGLQVIAPNDTATLRVPIPNGAYECRTATVSPLAKGTSAYS